MKVLIVDDSQTNLLLLKHLVARVEGCEPIAIDSALKAIEWCQENDPDIVLTDYMMPDMNGLELISYFRNSEKFFEIPVVMVTTADLKEVRQKALELGASDFITKPVDTTELLARLRNLLALRTSQKKLKSRSDQDLILRLSRAAEYRDPETGMHIERVIRYSALIAKAIGLSSEEAEHIQQASPMHDVGKVGILDFILLKPGPLTPDEFSMMKEHSRLGFEILDGSLSPLVQLAAEIALSHHEKFDGSGYPRGLSGTAIPVAGRIVAIADVFDALTSSRPYRGPWPLEKAIDFLKEEKGRHFDPNYVEAFLSCLNKVLEIRSQFPDPEREIELR
jgi:response regulator RpfG family c-di-GMP phosphodiesterase